MRISRVWTVVSVFALAVGGAAHAQPNLEVASFTGPSCAVLDDAIGDQILLTVANTGNADVPLTCSDTGASCTSNADCATGASCRATASVGYYVSTDATITLSDRLLSGGRENLAQLGDSGLPAGQTAAIQLFAGASVSSTFPDANPPLGDVFLGVVLDEFDTIAETDETDNTAAQPIRIESTTCGPDLVIDSITHFPPTPDTETQIQFDVVVKNAGGATAGASLLSFKIGGESPIDPAALFAVPSLAPGASFGVQRFKTLSVAQNYQNTAVADFNDDVAEADENNNTAIDSYTVVQAAEPALAGFVIASLPANGTLVDSLANPVVVGQVLPDTRVQYFPDAGFVGTDSFFFQTVRDGVFSSTALVDILVFAPVCTACVTLSVDLTGTGAGDVAVHPVAADGTQVCGTDCDLEYAPGGVVVLQARPIEQFIFTGWGGACSAGGSNPLVAVTLPSSGASSCTAQFDPFF